MMQRCAQLLLVALAGVTAGSTSCNPVQRACPSACPTGRTDSFDAYTYAMASPGYKRMHSSLSRVLQEDESLRSHVIMLEHPKLIQMNLQGFCCHSESEVANMTRSVDSFAWDPVHDLHIGGISCSPAISKPNQQPFPQGAVALELGLTADSHKSLLKLTRMVRHYASKETGIKIEPRASKFATRLAVVDSEFDMSLAISKLNEQLEKMSMNDKSLPPVQHFQFGPNSISNQPVSQGEIPQGTGLARPASSL